MLQSTPDVQDSLEALETSERDTAPGQNISCGAKNSSNREDDPSSRGEGSAQMSPNKPLRQPIYRRGCGWLVRTGRAVATAHLTRNDTR